MSDSNNVPVGQTITDVGEFIVQPMADAATDIAEEVLSNVVPGLVVSPSTQPVVDPNKVTQEDQEKIAEARWRIDQLKKTEQEIQKEREKKQQQEQVRLQQQQQEEQEEEAQQMQQQQASSQDLQDKQRQAEIRKGVGG